ncbi:ThiF family adenylyltransferase [Mesorhizobium sp. M1148]|uniref:ThiF family adenylyltransferase n=1 Tax=unclassified Mesorhizobium TaxID=325217 RepID=UPI00333B7C84
MNSRDALAIVDATLRNAGFAPAGVGPADYDGQIRVHGRPVDVSISIPDMRFATRPRITLKDPTQIPVETLAHIEEETGICYASGAGLPLDLYQPGEAILRVLEEASRTLELSYRGKGPAELIDEYQSYWKSDLTVRCMLPRDEVADGRRATLFLAKREGKVEFLCISSEEKLRGYESAFPRAVEFWRTEKLVGPIGIMMAPRTLADLKKWLVGHPDLHRDWRRLVQFLCADNCLFISAPNALLGISVNFPQDLKHAVSKGNIRQQALLGIAETLATKITLDRYSGQWSSLTDVTNRNNQSENTLQQKSIALIGCGTIGSNLARMLVQIGAGSCKPFSLFDNEVLAQGNIGRHLLGFTEIGKPKASAVAAELERFHPQVHVAAYEQDALEHLDVLAKHDLIIDATGSWNVQSAINEWYLDNSAIQTSALLHSWVFMNGAGVQSFLNLRDEFSCFRCLKPVFDGPWRFPVGDEKDELNLQPATCGDGSFIPFTIDAPMMAASLTTRAALDWANGHPGPRLRSAVVDLRRGRVQGPRFPRPSEFCPACASRRTSA